MPKSRQPLSKHVANLANAGTGKDRLAWLRLPPDTILVVPRLGLWPQAISSWLTCAGRLRALGAKVEWLASPK